MEFFADGTILFLILMGFLAAFIDAVVGGGGLITIPSIMCTGIPLVEVLGTNKMASVMGALSSFLTFIRAGKMDTALIRKLFPVSFLGSAAGVMLVRQMPSDFLRPLVLVMLIAVAIYSVVKKDWGTENVYHGMTRKMFVLSLAVAFVFGFYDGFFGPGTGSFLLFAFLLAGFDFLGAAANARALNFASNIAAALIFSYFGAVNFSYAIPMGIAMIFGATCGAKMALKKGTGYVRPLFILMTTVLIGKQILELFR